MKTCVMAAGDRMELHYLVGVGSEALRDGCRGAGGGHITLRGLATKTCVMAVGDRLGLHYLVWVGYEEALCDGCRGQNGVALPCRGWL